MMKKRVLVFLMFLGGFGALFAKENLGEAPERQKLDQKQEDISVLKRKSSLQEPKKKSDREEEQQKGKALTRAQIEQGHLRRELLVQARRELIMANRLLKQLPRDHPQRPDLLLRVLETNMYQAQLSGIEEYETYEKRWASWDKGGRQGPEPKVIRNKSLSYSKSVIRTGEAMLKDYPKHPQLDVVFYRLAYSYQTLGKNVEAVHYFQRLVKEFPRSQFLADSYFQLGDFAFAKDRYQEALDLFSKVLKYKRSNLYPWAIYKIAWVYYNLKQYQSSLKWFQRVVQESKKLPGLSPAAREQIRAQALRDMVNPYAELGDYRAAARYFAQEGGEKYYADLLMQLSFLLRERAQYANSVGVLRIYVSRHLDRFESAEIQIQAVDTASLSQNQSLLWREIDFLLKNFGEGSTWAKAHATHPRFPEVKAKIEKVALSFAQKEHALAQKRDQNYSSAIKGYQTYLKYYPSGSRADEVRFRLGEIQYSKENYVAASKIFLELVNQKQRSAFFRRAWKYLLSAAYLPIKKQIQSLRVRKVNLKGKPEKIDEEVRSYLTVCQRYMVTFPNGDPNEKPDPQKDFRACVVDSAEIYLKKNHFSQASRYLKFTAEKYSNRPEGVKAVEMLLFLNQKNNNKLYEIALEMIQKPAYKKGKLGIRLQKIIDSRSFDQALELQKRNKFREAALAFAAIYQKNPRGPDAATAAYNAGINFRKAKVFAKAMEFFLLVVKQFPSFSEAPNALIAAIQIAEEALALNQAVQGVDEFLKRFPKHSKASELEKQGCYFSTVVGDANRAERLCAKSKSAEAFESLFEMYESLLDQNRLQTLVKQAGSYGLSQAQRADYSYRQALLVRRVSNQPSYERFLIQVSKSYPASASAPEIRRIHAEAFWYQMVPLWKSYMSLKFVARTPDGSDLQKSIETKQARLAQLEPSFLKIVGYEMAEWSIAALYALGLAHLDLAERLKKAPLPSQLPPEVKKQLAASFSQLAQAPEKKGVAYHEKALEIARNTGVYTVYARDVRLELLKRSGQTLDSRDWIESADYVMTTLADIPPLQSVIEVLEEQ